MEWVERLQKWRRERRTARKFRKRQAWSQGLTVSETFEKIYANNKWGKSQSGALFYSGDGSAEDKSSEYERYVVDFLRSDPSISRWVDIGCGDFQVSDRILKAATANGQSERTLEYVGVDVARNLIEWHQEHHVREGVSFEVCNAVENDPPAGDLVTVRQVLQHLSNDDIMRILERLARLYRVAIISESLPIRFQAYNLDIRHGIAIRIPLGSGVYLDQPPFSMKVTSFVDRPYSEKEIIRTSVIHFDR